MTLSGKGAETGRQAMAGGAASHGGAVRKSGGVFGNAAGVMCVLLLRREHAARSYQAISKKSDSDRESVGAER